MEGKIILRFNKENYRVQSNKIDILLITFELTKILQLLQMNI